MKRFLSILVMGIVYASILLVCEIGLGLNGRQIFVIYIVSSLIIFVGAILFNLIYNVVYIKKIQKLLLLFDDGKFDECIDKLNAIEKNTKSKHIKNMAKLNIAFAFMKKKDYGEAKYILESFGSSLEKIPEVEMTIRLNLCLCCFYLKKYERAKELYTDSKPFFDKYRETDDYYEYFILLDMFMYVVFNKDTTEARKRLHEARLLCKDEEFEEDFEYLESIINGYESV
ncbi:MAG: hypothetical protein E6040_02985 [Lachnospiraceae bacterium]|nr:hypothetical protein [Lachnospiraceae bacterium]